MWPTRHDTTTTKVQCILCVFVLPAAKYAAHRIAEARFNRQAGKLDEVWRYYSNYYLLLFHAAAQLQLCKRMLYLCKYLFT